LMFPAHCQFFPNEMMAITIERKIPYGSPLHDKVCEQKLHLRMKQDASQSRGDNSRIACFTITAGSVAFLCVASA
jgi:hypothetical protein